MKIALKCFILIFAGFIAYNLLKLPFNVSADISSYTASEFSRYCEDKVNHSICNKVESPSDQIIVTCPAESQSISEVYVHAGDGQTLYQLPDSQFEAAYSNTHNAVTVKVTEGQHNLSYVGVICGVPVTNTPTVGQLPTNTPIATSTPEATNTPQPTSTPRADNTPTPTVEISSPTPTEVNSQPTATPTPTNAPSNNDGNNSNNNNNNNNSSDNNSSNNPPAPTATPVPAAGIGGGNAANDNNNPIIAGLEASQGEVLGESTQLPYTGTSDASPEKLPSNNLRQIGLSLAIPKLSFLAPIYQAVELGDQYLVGDKEVLEKEVNGAYFLYGHNSPDVFGRLNHLTVGDTLVRSAFGQEVTYRVTGIRWVSQYNQEVLSHLVPGSLVLVSCDPNNLSLRIVINAVPTNE
ncbi:sortase [Patescibacteria group bacterium]|nr:sortase [Patescibacteria group bacterium]